MLVFSARVDSLRTWKVIVSARVSSKSNTGFGIVHHATVMVGALVFCILWARSIINRFFPFLTSCASEIQSFNSCVRVCAFRLVKHIPTQFHGSRALALGSIGMQQQPVSEIVFVIGGLCRDHLSHGRFLVRIQLKNMVHRQKTIKNGTLHHPLEEGWKKTKFVVRLLIKLLFNGLPHKTQLKLKAKRNKSLILL